MCVLTVALTRTSPRRETIAVRALKLADGVADADYADADVRKDSDDERGADTNHKRTRASFETCSSCSTCVPHSELGEDDVVDSRGWCERCDCDVKVERIDAGNPGRYVGKSEAMVLRGVTSEGKKVSVKAWCGIRGQFRQHANATPVDETCGGFHSQRDRSPERISAIHRLIETMGFGRLVSPTEAKTLKFFTPRDTRSLGGKQNTHVLVTDWAKGIAPTDINGARPGQNMMTKELFLVVSRLKREDVIGMTLMDFLLGNHDRNIFNIFIDEAKGSLMLIDNEDMLKREDETSTVNSPGTRHHWHYVAGYVIYEKEKTLPWMERCHAKSANETKPACIVELENGNWPPTIGAILDYRCWVEGGAIHRTFPSTFSAFLAEVTDSTIEELMEKYSIAEEDVAFLKDRATLLNRYGFEGALKTTLLQAESQYDINAPCCDPLNCPWPVEESLKARREMKTSHFGPYVRNHKELNAIAQSFIGPNDAQSVTSFLESLVRIQDDQANLGRGERVEDHQRNKRAPTVEAPQHDDIPLLLSSSDPSFQWNNIERVDASTLSIDAFERKYVKEGQPVVIENANLATVLRSVVTRELILDLCGDAFADLGSKIVPSFQSMTKTTHQKLLRDLSERLETTRGLTLNETLDFLEGKGKIKTLRDFFDSEFMGESKIARKRGVDFLHPADNLWPPSVHSWHIIEQCPALAERVKAAVETKLRGDWSYISKILFRERPTEFKKFMLFASGDGVRAYHAHHHAKPAHVMVLVVQGSKRAVVWDRADEENLYPLSARVGGEELYNPVYLGNAFNVDLDKQPKIARSRGFGAVVEAGDILFMPCGWIHSFENVGETIQLVWSPSISYDAGEQSVVPISDDGVAKYCPNENGRDGFTRESADRDRDRDRDRGGTPV